MAQKKTKPTVLTPIDALAGSATEKMKAAFVRLNIPHNDALVSENIAKMERNNAFVGAMDKYYRTPVLRLSVYVDVEKLIAGNGLLMRSDWVAIAEIHKAHPQDYFTHPTTKKVYGRYTYFVPQFLVPDFEGYIPTPAELKKLTNPNDTEPLKYGYLIYRKASAATKKACKAR